jgi:hypothetical protein
MSSLRLTLCASLAGPALLSLAITSPAQVPDKEAASLVGKVLWEDGSPLTEGKVAFHPRGSMSRSASINKDGTFALKGLPAVDMAVTFEARGLHKVYSNPKTTPLRVRVEPGRNDTTFKLKKL